MDKAWMIIPIIFSKIDVWLRWFLGGYDGALCALVVFVVIDCITAIMCAIADKKMSRTLGLKDIFKKVLIFVLVGMGHILDTYIIDANPILRFAVVFFYLSSLGISILENASNLGLSIPKKLKTILEQLHDHSEKENH